MTFAEDLDAALKTAVCGWLANGGNVLLGQVVLNGLRTPASAVPAAAAGLGLLALNANCSFDPDAGVPGPSVVTGCLEASTGFLELGYYDENGGFAVPGGRQLRKVESVTGGTGTCPPGHSSFTWRAVQTNGSRWDVDNLCIAASSLVSRLSAGGTCAYQAPDVQPGVNPPVTYVSPTTNCTYVVDHEAWVVGDDGNVSPVVKISAGDPAARASGGVIGGCNFDPVIVIGGPGGPGGPVGPYYGPWNPGPDGPDGTPWWWPIATTAIGNLIAAGIRALVNELLEEREPGRVYRIVSVCEKDANGDPISQSREVTIPTLPLLNAAVARLDAIEVLLQGVKDFKQPVCGLLPATRSGEPVTVTFQSDGVSPVSGNSLVKMFKYFDQTGKSLEEHAAHWKGFTWQAGDVVVSAFGTALGKPQVWAASEAEGRRVIEHAASVAGVDLVGASWKAVTPANPRYGLPGLMRVKDYGGYLWVTKRPDPSGSPELAAP